MINPLTERRQWQASAWFHKFQSEDVTPREWREFRKWYSNKNNREAFDGVERVDRILLRMPALQTLSETDRAKDEYDGSTSVLRWLLTHTPRGRAARAEPAAAPPSTSGPWRYVVVVCLLAIANVLFWVVAASRDEQRLDTAIGEWHARVLEDQSKVTLGPQTKLSVTFQTDQRLLHLSRGEALFDVARDPARPFTVVTPLARIRALGTQFGVAYAGNDVVVTVKQGEVAVLPNQGHARPGRAATNPALAPALTLYAGDQVRVSRAGLDVVQRVNAPDALAWAAGQLVCHDVPLATVVQEFNRRNRLQIWVEDPTLAQTNINGRFDISKPEQFARFLASAMPLKMRRSGPHRLDLVRVDSATANE